MWKEIFKNCGSESISKRIKHCYARVIRDMFLNSMRTILCFIHTLWLKCFAFMQTVKLMLKILQNSLNIKIYRKQTIMLTQNIFT